MTALITNNASASLAADITNSDTSFSVTSNGSLFPAPTGSDYALATLADASGNVEIIKYTARTGNAFSGITRAQDGTSARAFVAGDKIELRPVAAHFTPAAIGAAPKTTGSAILKGDGAGGTTSAVSGTDYAPATTGSSLLKASSGGFAAAVAGTDYAPATSGTSILKGDGSGGTTAASAGTDFQTAQSVTGIVKSSGTTRSAAVAGTDYIAPYGSTTGNWVLASPNGAPGTPTFRALVAADIPTLNQNTTGTSSNVTGTVAIGNGGTGQTSAQAAMNALAGAVTSTYYLRGSGANVVMSAIQAGDVPTLNQNTTGTAAAWTTARALAGNSVSGAADVAFANKFVVQGTTDAGLTGAQFLGALGTGLVKNTTTTGVLSIAVAGTDYAAPNQTMFIGTTSVAINRATAALSLTGVNIDGSAGTAGSATTATTATNLTGGNGTTGLGTLHYQSGTDTTSTLAPNTSATKKFLRQTGTGVNGAAPAWDTVTATDVGLSAVENTALSTWAGTANIVSVGTITTGTWSGTAIADNKIASALTGKTYNALTLTAQATGFTIAGGTTSKTLTLSNTLTLAGTDSSTLNIGAGGTLGSAAFTASTSYLSSAGGTLTGSILVSPGTATNPAYSGYVNTGGSAYVGIDDSTGATLGGVAYAFNFYYGSATYPMVFFTNTVERMRIAANGLITFSAGTVNTKGAMAALDIDLTKGNYFEKTLSTGANTVTVSNATSGGSAVNSFILKATSTGSSSITFGTGFTSVKYVNGSALSLTSGGVDIVSGFTLDGANWFVFVSKAMA